MILFGCRTMIRTRATAVEEKKLVLDAGHNWVDPDQD
jgi:hypothetical protein